MPRAIRGEWPRPVVRVIDLQHDAAGFFAQAHSSGAVGELVGKSTEYARYPICRLDVAGSRRDDQELVSSNSCAFGKCVIPISCDAPTADVFEERVGIVEFDELQVPSVDAI